MASSSPGSRVVLRRGCPAGIWLLLLIGFAIALGASGKPFAHLGHVRIGFGGIEQFALFWCIAIEVLALALLVSWTTPLADLAPALGRLGWPLRKLRLPVDEVVGAIALSIRCLPLLLEEGRVLSAARRARRASAKVSPREMAEGLEDLIWAALSNALRRAREIAEAIEARGGVPDDRPRNAPLRPPRRHPRGSHGRRADGDGAVAGLSRRRAASGANCAGRFRRQAALTTRRV